MTEPQGVQDLEAALIDRAERLATEYLARAEDGRDAILKEERDRLRAREERITEDAQADADRLYRRRVQAAQLKSQSNLDRERWNLIQSVIEELPRQMASVADDTPRYESLLLSLLTQAADSIGEDNLVVTLNARDREAFGPRWTELAKRAAPGVNIELDSQPARISGGVRVTTKDNRVRIDASFEGRIERFQNELVQVIAERLFAEAVT